MITHEIHTDGTKMLEFRLSGWRLLRDAIRVLLEGTPEWLDLEALQQDVQ
ncbi:MAG: hypothetical protein ABIH24_03930 [Verrucomicrobiota bacterium]